MVGGPLQGLRVLELATGVAGPYAGRLLAELGATVVKVEPEGGDPCRRLPVDDAPPREPSPLFVHLNVGKRMVTGSVTDLSAAARWADVVLVDRSAAYEIEPSDDTVVVRVTASAGEAWDPGADDPRWELLAQAASGLMPANADDGREPLRFPGWQAQYLAGAYAAAGALAGLATGARLVETTWVGAATTGVEGEVAAYLYAATAARRSEDGDRRQAGFQARAFPAGAFACADGFVIPGTVRPEDWALQCKVYGRPDLADDERFTWSKRWLNRAELLAEVEPWYRQRGKREIFEAALGQGWAAAMVMTGADAIVDVHMAERGFLGRVVGGGADGAAVPVRPWRSEGLAEGGEVRLGGQGEDDAWFEPARRRAEARPAPPAPERLRVVELTWAWAGPFVGRFLGGLGADVVRIETGARPDGWRTRLKWKDIGAPIPDGVDPESYTWDAAALFNTLGRNKRSLSVDLVQERGRELFVGLLERADLLIVNMTYRVLADRGVEADVRRLIDSGLVVLNMPALGTSGPYRDMPGYGMLTEGMGGMAARAGYEDQGARASTTYYPDAVAGIHGVVAALSALAGRQRTGRGRWVDFSQQEVLWQQFGEAIVLASLEGREPARMGNCEPGADPSGVIESDGGYAAVVGSRSAVVESFASLFRSGRMRERGAVEELDHPVAGHRAYVQLPLTFDGRPLRSTRPAPTFGQHTGEVLADWLGLAEDEISELRTAEVVGTVPRQPTRR